MVSTIELIGTWYRCGTVGPIYEVIGDGEPSDREPTMRIRVLESGEELDYPLRDILADPREA